jgi:hypothetical protein
MHEIELLDGEIVKFYSDGSIEIDKCGCIVLLTQFDLKKINKKYKEIHER